MGKVVITGAGGLIGSELCKYLYSKHIDILAVYRTKPVIDDVPWDYMISNLEDSRCIHEFSKLKLKCLVHAAAAIPNNRYSYEDCYTINKSIDLNVLELLKAVSEDSKFIYFSTTNLYGRTKGAISEESEIVISNKYAEAKLFAERLFTVHVSNTSILRINAPYSPYQSNETVLKKFIDQALANKDLVYSGSGSRQQDFTHAKDIAEAVFCAITNSNVHGIFNISAGYPIDMKSLAELIISKLPNCKSKVYSSGSIDLQEGHQAVFDTLKARNILNWRPEYNIEQGIEEWIKVLTK